MMGLFSSVKETHVATSVTRAVTDNLLPDAIKTGMVKGLLSGDQLVENVMEEMVNSIGIKAERMYTYGKEGYIQGVPKSTLLYNASGEAVLQEILDTLENTPVTLAYYHYGPLNLIHYGWTMLYAQYGYDQVSNILSVLSAQKGYPVYLKDMVAVVAEVTLDESQNGSLETWGTSPLGGYTVSRPIVRQTVIAGVEWGIPVPDVTATLLSGITTYSPLIVDTASTADHLLVTYEWRNTATRVIHVETLTIPIGVDATKDYYHAKYVVGNQIKYWTYQDGSGTYPELDAVFSPVFDDVGSFFPILYFRHNNHTVNSDPTSAEYKSSKKLAKYLNINYGDMLAKIHENPDIETIEQAMLMMAVPAKSTNPLEQRYLFDFFKRLYLDSGAVAMPITERAAEIRQNVLGRGYSSANNTRISMQIQDAQFKMALSMDGIYRTNKVGVVGAVGAHTSGTGVQTVWRDIRYELNGEMQGGVTNVEVPYHYYRRQITASIFEELRVYNLSMQYFVYQNYTTTSLDSQRILMIPLDHAITEDYSIPERETLYARSLHYVFNSLVEVNVKWYQQDWFQFVVIVVAMFMTFSGMGDPGSMGALLAAGTLTFELLVAAIFVTVLEFLIIKYVFTLFVKMIGVDAAIILAIVMTAYLGAQSLRGSGVQGAPWAKELMALVTGLGKATQTVMQEELMEEATDFSSDVEKQEAALTKANALLEQNNHLVPTIYWGQSPSEYFATKSTGNIGTYGLEAIHNYHDVLLSLPTIDQSLGSRDMAY